MGSKSSRSKPYPPKLKSEVVARSLKGDVPKRQIADEAGISETTLFRWVKEAQAQPGKVAHLRAVPADEPPPAPPRRQTTSQAAEGGDRRELLVAMRARIARTVDDPNTPARDLAALTRRLLEIAKEIEAIDLDDGDDEIGKAAATDDEAWDESAI